MTKAAFKSGMLALAKAYSRTLDEATSLLYFRILGPLSDEDWRVAVDGCLASERFWPPPSVLLDFAKPQATEIMVDAQKEYEQIVSSYERGQTLNVRHITAARGPACAAAFMAAGGSAAFAWCEEKNEPFRRKAFIEHFQKVARTDPGRLPARRPSPALSFGVPDALPAQTTDDRLVLLRSQAKEIAK